MTTEQQTPPEQIQEPPAAATPEPQPAAPAGRLLGDVLAGIGQQLQRLSHSGQCAFVVVSVIVNELGEGQIVCEPDAVLKNGHIVQAANNLAQVINISRPKRQPQPMVAANPPAPATEPTASPASTSGPIAPKRERRKR